jgi:hypothetical protein
MPGFRIPAYMIANFKLMCHNKQLNHKNR